jgi:hypothetical protein
MCSVNYWDVSNTDTHQHQDSEISGSHAVRIALMMEAVRTS